MAEKRPRPSERPAGAPSLPEKVISIHRALDKAHIPHAVGGALALAYYAEPRATIDVDLNVFVSTERWGEIRAALEPLGIDVSVDAAALKRNGQVRLWWDRNPVDLFFSYDEFHDAMRHGSRRVPFADTTLPILAPEHLAVCKAMFNRTKDWLDIEQILVATDPVDVAEIEGWLEKMVGDSDPRIQKLRELRDRLAIP
jgi:hypothetical protein